MLLHLLPEIHFAAFYHWCFSPGRNFVSGADGSGVVLSKEPSLYVLRKNIEVGGWSRKWQFFLTLCYENVLSKWVGGSKKPQKTLT